MEKSASTAGPVRYAVRQVLDQELRKEKLVQSSLARHARSVAPAIRKHDVDEEDKENQSPLDKAKEALSKESGAKRDFFGRIINESRPMSAGKGTKVQPAIGKTKDEGRMWVSFHEGFSNAVRKPVTLKELMDGF